VRPHACPHEGCGATFVQSGALTNHVRSYHTPGAHARQKRQEQRVARALDAAGIDYKREHRIDFRCIGDADNAYARVDFLLLLFGCVVFLEVDEDQHKFGYGSASCDMKRMSKIIETLRLDGNTMKIVFVRYNPNKYRVDSRSTKGRLAKKEREQVLLSLLQDRNHGIFTSASDILIQYMYFDTVDGQAEVTRDPQYNPVMRECCLPVIVD
jgi:hypothetical protein